MTYTACIMATERVSQNADPLVIGIIQLGLMGALSLLIAVPAGGFALPQSGHEWLLMLLLVLLCSCFGFAFQPQGQKYVSAETAAILTVINPMTACVMGILVAGDSVTVPKLIGFVLILLSLAIYHVNFKRGKTKVKS